MNIIAEYRLRNQQISAQQFGSVAEVVRHLGAVQAQDYLAALFAIGLRTPQATEAVIEQAVADKAIVRTWPMRGTLHFVHSADVRWLLKTLTPRVIAQSAGRYKELELDAGVFGASEQLLGRALAGGHCLTRAQCFAVLEAAGIATANQRGIHILSYLAQRGVVCFGPRAGKQPTFTLLDEWVPPAPMLAGDEALATLALRYFGGHGPATLADFARWAGLTMADAQAGLQAAKAGLVREVFGEDSYWMVAAPYPSSSPPRVYLLPAFDEYIIGYKERGAVLAAEHVQRVIPGVNGMFKAVVVSAGLVIGTWQRKVLAHSVRVVGALFREMDAGEADGFVEVAGGYGAFLGKAVEARWALVGD